MTFGDTFVLFFLLTSLLPLYTDAGSLVLLGEETPKRGPDGAVKLDEFGDEELACQAFTNFCWNVHNVCRLVHTLVTIYIVAWASIKYARIRKLLDQGAPEATKKELRAGVDRNWITPLE